MRVLIAAAALVLSLAPVTGIAGRDPITGRYVSLEHWKGRAVAVNVWASWCTGCKQEAAALRQFEQAHRDSVLGIDFGDSKPAARAFYRRHDFDHPNIFDPRGLLVAKLKAIGLPTTVFLNRRHVAVYAVAGAGTLKQFEAGWRKATGS